MSKTSPANVFSIDGTAEFCDHIATLVDDLKAVQNSRKKGPIGSASAHHKLQDRALHDRAQASADLLTEDLQKFLHPGLGFQDWFLKVKAGGTSLRWARKGSNGRGGADLDVGYAPQFIDSVCSWVAVCLNLPEHAPVERSRMKAVGLDDASDYLFEITVGSVTETMQAPTPTLALLKCDMLDKLPDFLSFAADVQTDYRDSPRERLVAFYRQLHDMVKDFPEGERQRSWAPWPELKLRLAGEPLLRTGHHHAGTMFSSGLLLNTDRDALAVLALRMAQMSRERQEAGDETLWVVACYPNNPGQVVSAPGPACALARAAFTALRHPPEAPSPFEEWNIYPVSAEPLTDIAIPKDLS